MNRLLRTLAAFALAAALCGTGVGCSSIGKATASAAHTTSVRATLAPGCTPHGMNQDGHCINYQAAALTFASNEVARHDRATLEATIQRWFKSEGSDIAGGKFPGYVPGGAPGPAADSGMPQNEELNAALLESWNRLEAMPTALAIELDYEVVHFNLIP